jgi:hypothetical protein
MAVCMVLGYLKNKDGRMMEDRGWESSTVLCVIDLGTRRFCSSHFHASAGSCWRSIPKGGWSMHTHMQAKVNTLLLACGNYGKDLPTK